MAAHSVRAVPEAALAAVAAAAGDRPRHVHLSEQPAENAATQAYYGCSPAELLARTGFLGPTATAVHATHLSDADVVLLGRSGTSCCICPTTERDLADGIGPARALRDAGSPLTLGSDSQAVVDPFEELRGLEMHERLRTTCRGRFTPAELLAAATRAGYTSLGWAGGGVIAAGAPADFVVVRTDTVRTAGADPAQIAFAATAADVDRVVVAGADGGVRRRAPARAGRPVAGPGSGGTGMTATVVTGIGELVTCDDTGGDRLGIRTDAAVVVDEGRIAWLGPRSAAPPADAQVDVAGRTVLPGFVDAHSHLVFAGDRAAEFAARMTGEPYDGGGIATTVAATRAASDDELRRQLAARMAELRSRRHHDRRDQERLRAHRRRRGPAAADRRRGDHGDHAARGPRRAPGVAARPRPATSTWSPARCSRPPRRTPAGSTCSANRTPPTPSPRTRRGPSWQAGRTAGLGLRVHGNQLGPGPGVRLAVELGAASVDHCTHLSAADVDALADAAGDTVATLLPGVEFCTRSPYPDAARLRRAGVPIALATDCNPGTCYSSSMPFVIALAVRELGLTPAEALYAATVGGARALRRTDVGRIAVGQRADLTVLDAPSYLHLAYRPGMPLTRPLVLP